MVDFVLPEDWYENPPPNLPVRFAHAVDKIIRLEAKCAELQAELDKLNRRTLGIAEPDNG